MRGGRDGFALLAVLWAVALGSAIVLASAIALDFHGTAVTNRMALTRAFWAEEACLAQLRAGFVEDAPSLALDTVELGNDVWCTVRDVDPSLRIHLNEADSTALARLLGVAVGAAVLDWRDVDDDARDMGAEAEWYAAAGRPRPANGPFRDPSELRRVRGVDDAFWARVADLVTVRGDGRVDVNRAPRPVVRALSVLRRDAADRLLTLRDGGRIFNGYEALSLVLDPTGEGRLDIPLQEVRDRVRFTPELRVAEIRGGVRRAAAGSVESRMVVTMRQRGDVLSVLSREVQ